MEGDLGGWELALVSCSTLVIFSRLRFSLELLDRMKLNNPSQILEGRSCHCIVWGLDLRGLL